jgi:hypothetical protein
MRTKPTPEKRKAQRRAISRGYYARNSESLAAKARAKYHKHPDANLLRRYGSTVAERDALFAAQGQVCACCGTDQPGWRRGWHVEHDHTTRVVRGVLCMECNHLLGRLGDNRDEVTRRSNELIGYLARGPALKIGAGQ